MQLSIVSTLYQSEPYLDEFIQRICTSAAQISNDFELILVNDGSPDGSLAKAIAAKQQYPQLKIIELSRNFGHHAAFMTGLEQAQGEFIFLIDCDLEEAPELIVEFWTELLALDDVDMLYGVQPVRQGNWFKQKSGNAFYWLFNRLSDYKITPNAMTVRLMRKYFVDALNLYQERNLFGIGIMAHAGFKQQGRLVTKRLKPESTYTLSRQLKLFCTSIIGFSNKPLLLLLNLAGYLLLMAVLVFVYNSIGYFAGAASFTLAHLLMFFSLLIMACICFCSGLLGLYLANINDEIKNRPRTIIRRIY